MTVQYAIPFSLALVQINVTVGDVAGNSGKIAAAYEEAAAQDVDLVVFPESTITGYPPEDLMLKSAFQNASIDAAHALASLTKGKNRPAMLLGGVWLKEEKLYNVCFLIDEGEIKEIITKCSLPNYGVFDEKRIFDGGDAPRVTEWRGHKLGIIICEELWDAGNVPILATLDAELLISINASPFETGKQQQRRAVAGRAVDASGLPLVYINMVGGQDEIVFDGDSFVLNSQGEEVFSGNRFVEEVRVFAPANAAGSGHVSNPDQGSDMHQDDSQLSSIYSAMVLGLRDYVGKNGFPGVLVGMSGGIDSGLTAAIATDALGPDKVHCILMPSPYTSEESITDATQCADVLGVRLDTINITAGMQVFDGMLSEVFASTTPDKTEENIQARIRGMLLMAISNKHGKMVLTTGNKSELSVGYATLYGDMCGGYSVLKDVYKTTVFELARWRNAFCGRSEVIQSKTQSLSIDSGPTRQASLSSQYENMHLPLFGPSGRVIPDRMITKAPTAELRPNQKDEDSLPPYVSLDAILHALIEKRNSPEEAAQITGHSLSLCQKVATMLLRTEYKRRQAPPGVRISNMSFGKDRRWPVTNKWT